MEDLGFVELELDKYLFILVDAPSPSAIDLCDVSTRPLPWFQLPTLPYSCTTSSSLARTHVLAFVSLRPTPCHR